MSSDSSSEFSPPTDLPTPAAEPSVPETPSSWVEPAPFAAYGRKTEPSPTAPEDMATLPMPVLPSPTDPPPVPSPPMIGTVDNVEAAATESEATVEPTPAADSWDVADDLDHSLDPDAVTIERVASFIGTAILGVVLLAPTIGGSIAASAYWPIFVGAWAALMLLLCARSWFWPPVAYRHTSYRLSRRGLVIRRGVWWRSVAHVPRSRVQHTDVSQGPLQRYFELGTLTVHTAGTEFASISLEGLNREVADRIRDVLIDGGDDDGV